MGHSRPLFLYFRLFNTQLTVNQIGRFLKVLGDIVLTKVAQILGHYLGSYKNIDLTAVTSFWTTFGIIWTSIYANIWSHCVQQTRSQWGRPCKATDQDRLYIDLGIAIFIHKIFPYLD